MKVKIKSTNRTQQVNVINKCKNWGAVSRDGDYGPVAGKTAVVINTKLGGGGSPALQLSRVDFTPQKSPYDLVLSYKDFMNATECPWDSGATTVPSAGPYGDTGVAHSGPEIQIQVKPVPVPYPVEVETGVCAQDTLKVIECSVLTQEDIAWKTLGLPFLQDNGIEVTMSDGTAYILNTKKNTAKPLTAKTAAKKARKDILADEDSAWVDYARKFDLVETATLNKHVEDED